MENIMALKFNQAQGSAKKDKIDQYTYKEGDNVIRLVGDILPRYVYWIKGENGKNIPMECLAYDRETETFNNKEKDYVRDFFPDLKCGWAYAIQGIDPADGNVKVVNLKKKLMEQIMVAAEDLGDPTDPETGWDVCFQRVKTGPMAFNVEYRLQALKCKPRPLNETELAATADLRSMDDVLPRPTADAQLELLQRVTQPSEGAKHLLMLTLSSVFLRRTLWLSVGDRFPSFSMLGVNDTDTIVDVDILLNEWTVMYFYPKDFTFICPTEIVDMDKLVHDADIIGVSADNEFCKLAWKATE